MKTSSAKQKGRRLALLVREMLLSWAPDLDQSDIRVTSSGAGGEDVPMSKAARDVYPISIECKNCEKTDPWAWYEQAKDNAGDHIPTVIFSRNRSEPMVMIKFEHFLKLIR